MIYNIETLTQSKLLRLIMEIYGHYKIDAIDEERIREELDKTETLERKKQIANDIANSGYSQEWLLNDLSNISDHGAEVDNISNATTETHNKSKSASVQGLIDATNGLIKEMAAKIYDKKVVRHSRPPLRRQSLTISTIPLSPYMLTIRVTIKLRKLTASWSEKLTTATSANY